jgi:hypothetical protein
MKRAMFSLSNAAHVRALTCAALLCHGCARETPIVAGTPTIEFRTTPGAPEYGAVDVIHLGAPALGALRAAEPTPVQWQEILPVRANDSTATPMLGEYEIAIDRIRFTPRFPPTPGNTYIARFNAEAFARISGAELEGAAEGTWRVVADVREPTTTITAIYPTTDNVPMNLLKLYIHFSAPMSVGESMERIRILDDSGNVVDGAFLIPAGNEELWDSRKTRLTLLFDPGRIKRDLRPNEERGLPLQAGREYVVVIDSAWKDAQGVALARPARKTLRVGQPDRVSPRTSTWRVTAPAARSKNAVVLAFPEPLDQALLSRLLSVRTADGAEVSGAVEIEAEERRWLFTPDAPWAAAPHYIEVDTDLEDLAGNSLRKLFDMAPEDSSARLDARVVRVGFTPK